MKILYIITRSDVVGGASVHLLDLALGMISKGHEVKVLVGGEGVFYERLVSAKISTKSVSSLKRNISLIEDIKCYSELKSELKEFSPDVVHLHSSKAGILGRIAAYRLGISSVFTAHGWSFTDGVSYFNRVIYKNVEKLVSKISNKIITVSEYDRQLALNNNVGTEHLIKTIRNGVVDKTQKHIPVTSDKIVKLIMVARFDKQKNQRDLIDVLYNLKDLPFEVSFVGDGPLLNEAKTQVENYRLNGKVKFLGARHDVEQLLSMSQVFLLITNWEGLPLTILEAMSNSLPIIASDVGGVCETIDDGVHGFLIPRGDKTRLQFALTELIQREALRKKFGNAARKKYENEFLIQRMIDETENVYVEVFKHG